MSSMYKYLERVNEVMVAFEKQLWSHLDNFLELSGSNPTLLVDCLRVIELQVWTVGVDQDWVCLDWVLSGAAQCSAGGGLPAGDEAAGPGPVGCR